MTVAYIGLGSNLDNPVKQITTALQELDQVPETEVLAKSSFYLSKPLGPQDQPDYINSAAMLNTSLSASGLLDHLLNIEFNHGRTRGPNRWQARTLDLDLLLYGREQIREKALVVPHPEISNRNFVLVPLAEITPGLDIPGIGSVDALIKKTGMADIKKIKTDNQ